MKSFEIGDVIWDHFKIPPPTREYKFHPTRRWRIDFAWPECKVAVEIEGGAYTKGRHTRPIGFIKDMEKYNQLTMYGWRLLRFTPNNVSFDLIKILITKENKQ